tara:strand:+ start:346 stop:492 length:147 start_codon:yes stop_codon:yes gene_type:complete
MSASSVEYYTTAHLAMQIYFGGLRATQNDARMHRFWSIIVALVGCSKV